MERCIRIRAGAVAVLAELNNSSLAEAIWQALPFYSRVHTRGEEIYFTIPLKRELEEGQEIVNLGDLGYWPPGRAFCLFFGPTPVSRPSEIRAASPVGLFGRLVDDPKLLRKVKEGEEVVVEKAPAQE